MKKTTIWCLAGLMMAASSAAAQSLGELAKKEEARRKAIPKPGKVYTNDDLRRLGGRATPAPPVAEPMQPVPEQPAVKVEQAEPKGDEPVKDEAWWRERIGTVRSKIESNKLMADAFQSRLNALTMDFVGRDDPAQRAQVAAERERVLAEITRLQEETAKLTEEIAAIEEEARQAGVPPGWLR